MRHVAYHSVNGWYIATSSEHYHTHKCHVKATQSKRLTDTVQFQHINITNPIVTHAEKVMKVISDRAKTTRGMKTDDNDIDIQQLENLEELTEKAIEQNFSIAQVFP